MAKETKKKTASKGASAEKGKEVVLRDSSRKGNQIKLRGRTFEGDVVKIFPGRLTIQFDRLIYHPKYERYEKRKSKMHARIPEELQGKISVGDRVRIAECRPLSKIMHAVVTKIISTKGGEKKE